MSSFSKDTIITFCTGLIVFPLSTVSTIILARSLGAGGKGIVTVCILIPSMTSLILGFDINIAGVYFTGTRKYRTQTIIRNLLFISILTGFIAFALLVLLSASLSSRFLDGGNRSMLYLAATFPVLIILTKSLSGVLLGLRKVMQISIITILSRLFYIIFLILLLYVRKMNVLGGVIAFGFMNLVGLSIAIIWTFRNGYNISISPQSDVISDLFKYSAKNYAGSISQSMNYRLDMFLVAYFLTSSEVGIYSIAVWLVELIWRVPESVGYILLPQTSASTTEQANSFSPVVIRNTFFLTLLITITLFMLVGWLIPALYGTAFSRAVLPARILLPGILSLGIWKVISNDMAGRGLPQYKSYSAAISLLLTTLLDVILIPRLGIAGAALASSIAYFAATVLAFIFFVKISKIRITEIFVPTSSDIRYIKGLLRSTRA